MSLGGSVRRWAAILLPIVIVLRVLLLIFQLHSRDDPAPDGSPPHPWPPHSGQELRFRSDNRSITEWAAIATHKPFLVALLEKDFVTALPGTGCLLDPGTMQAHGGGTLTVGSQDKPGTWQVRWSGSSTMPDSYAGEQPTKPVEGAMLAAASCGSEALLQIPEAALHGLVNMVAGLPPPPPGPRVPDVDLTIRVDGSVP